MPASRRLNAADRKKLRELEASLDLRGKSPDAERLRAICEIDPKRGVQLCQRALEEGSPQLRSAALKQLAVLSPDEAREAAVAILSRRNQASLRQAALVTLLKVGLSDAAVPLVVELLRRKDFQLWHQAVEVFRTGSRAAAEALTPLLDDPEQDVRKRAAWALNRIGPEAAPAVPSLCRMLRDADWFTACCAAATLGAIGPGASGAVKELRKRLPSSGGRLRVAVADALFRITGQAARSLKVLIPAVLDSDIQVRRDAALALERMGPAGRPAGPALLKLLKERTLHGRHFAARALTAIGADPAVVVPLLLDMLRNGSAHYEEVAAVESLGRYGPAASVALPALEELRRRKRSKYVQEAVLPALAAIRGQAGRKGDP